MPRLSSKDSAAYVLKSCKQGPTVDVIVNVDDDIDQMWMRLDEKYGRPSKLIDIIMCDIKNLKGVPEGDDEKFISLVNLIERGHRDLKRINCEREISNATVLSMIEAVLPKTIMREWSREVICKGSKYCS